MKEDKNKFETETIPLGLLHVSDQGKITIPFNIRKRFKIKKGDFVETTIVVKLRGNKNE